MTFTKAVKPADLTVSKYDEIVTLLFRSKDKNSDFNLHVECKLSYAIEHFGLTDRVLLETPNGVKTLTFCGYSLSSADRVIENFNGYQPMPCGATSGH